MSQRLALYNKFKYAIFYILVKLAYAILALFILSLLGLIFYLFYKPSTYLLSPLLASIVSMFLLHGLLLYGCRKATFPGSTWYWKRSTENYFLRKLVPPFLRKIVELRDIVEAIIIQKNIALVTRGDDILQIGRDLAMHIKIYKKLEKQKRLSKRQKRMMNVLSGLVEEMKTTRIVAKAEEISLAFWSLFNGDATQDIFKRINKKNGPLFSFEMLSQGNKLIERCKDIEIMLKATFDREKHWYYRLVRWINEDSFGSLDQLREEIEELYVTKRISIQTNPKVYVDCILVSELAPTKPKHSSPAPHPGDEADPLYHPAQQLPSINLAKPTMIFCQPNAGYYETIHQDNIWLDMYLHCGLNVVLWNYRGFGRSTGTPSPDTLRRDGEAIVDYLRQELKIQRIGAHGESMGGSIATHIARSKKLDYLCADRTFVSLSKVAELSYGKAAGIGFKLITMWTDNVAKDFLEAGCYKIVTVDPQDEMIHLLASLKHGVTLKAIEEKVLKRKPPVKPIFREDFNFFSPWRFIHWVQNIKYMCAHESYSYSVNKQLAAHYKPLTKDETLALYWAFHRLSEMIINASCGSLFGDTTKRKFSYSSKRGSEKSKNLSTHQKSTDYKSIELSGTELNHMDSIPGDKRGLMLSEDNLFKRHGKTQSFMRSHANLLKTTIKKTYLEVVQSGHAQASDIEDLVSELSPIFEDLEAGGVELLEVMGMPEDIKFEAFRHFIRSFDIWGSHLPSNPTELVKTENWSHKKALTDLGDFIEKISCIITQRALDLTAYNSTDIIQWILSDLEVIRSLMSSLHHHLSTKLATRGSIEAHDAITINANEINEYKDQENTLEDRLIEHRDPNYEPLKSTGPFSVGHLIPLACGHNGVPNNNELEIYQQHLFHSDLFR